MILGKRVALGVDVGIDVMQKGLCCTNQLMDVVPPSPDGLIP